MSNINMVMLSGNITRDPEIRATASGLAVLSFGLAVNDRRKNPHTDEWEDYANFVDCVIMGRRAEALSPILTKGMKISVGGKLRYSSWERDGQKRSKIDVLVNDVELMQQRDSKATSASQNYQPNNNTNQVQTYQQGAPGQPQGAPGQGYYYQQQQQAQPQAQYSLYDEDIPF